MYDDGDDMKRQITATFLLTILLVGAAPACTPALTPTATAIPSDAVEAIKQYLVALEQEGTFSGSVLITQGDQVLLRAGYGWADIENGIPNGPQTQFRLGSVTKQFTAMAILILQERGDLDLEERACVYLPACPKQWQAITIHQLLTHSSGLPDAWRFYAGRNVPGIDYDPEEILSWFAGTALDFEPGERFAYSNTGYLLLGWLIESVSGQTYEEFLRREIFDPLQMTDTGYLRQAANMAVGYSEPGQEAGFLNASLAFSAGGLYSTSEDLFHWDQALRTEELVSRESMEAIFASHIAAPPLPYSPAYDDLGYGYGWFVGENWRHPVAGHGGTYDGYRALIERYDAGQVTIILLCNLASSTISVTTFPAEAIFANE
jgi:CubicO group peptidase (beta-lactamase class C family)